MTRRLPLIASWLLAGHGVWLALFWGLLQVPESSPAMLALSALLVVGLVVLGAAVHGGAMAAWDPARPVGRALASGVRYAGAALLASIVFGLVFWGTAAVLEWHTRVAGQIDALYLSRTGRTGTTWIHAAIVWTTMALRWAVGLSLAVSLLGALVAGGVRALTSAAWLRAAMRPARWLAAGAAFGLLVALPWQHTDWRPASLSLALEPWFVAAKFIAIGVVMAVGWALVLRVGYEATEPQSSQR
jgi:hypothetical protein